jgi:hypothetical protein
VTRADDTIAFASYRRGTDGLDGKEQVMARTRTRIAVSLSVSCAVVTAIAGTAGARIPEGDGGLGTVQARPAAVALAAPDAVERAVQRRAHTLEAKFAGPDAVARAIAHRNR